MPVLVGLPSYNRMFTDSWSASATDAVIGWAGTPPSGVGVGTAGICVVAVHQSLYTEEDRRNRLHPFFRQL